MDKLHDNAIEGQEAADIAAPVVEKKKTRSKKPEVKASESMGDISSENTPKEKAKAKAKTSESAGDISQKDSPKEKAKAEEKPKAKTKKAKDVPMDSQVAAANGNDIADFERDDNSAPSGTDDTENGGNATKNGIDAVKNGEDAKENSADADNTEQSFTPVMDEASTNMLDSQEEQKEYVEHDGPQVDVAEAMRRILRFAAKAEGEEAPDENDSADENSDKNDSAPSENSLDSALSTREADAPCETDEADLTDGKNDTGADEDIKKNTDEKSNIENEIADTQENTPRDEGVSAQNSESDNTAQAEICREDPEDDDEYVLEDEFSNIPESFVDDDIFGDDDTSSISALLYDEDDATAGVEFERHTSVSFSELKMQMQMIKDEAMERSTKKNEDAPTETPEEEFAEEEEHAAESEIDDEDGGEEVFPDENITPEDIPHEADEEKISYIREVEKDADEETDDTDEYENEHIITIDRTRVRDKSVPEGRLIDTAFEIVEIFSFTILIILTLLTFVFRHTTVVGDSMLPTFEDGDRLIISSLFYRPDRGDIIVFDDRSNEGYNDEPIIKRIIGLEGDTVKIEGGVIYVKESGTEDFSIVDYGIDGMDIPAKDMNEIVVPEGEIFVMGDNVNNSLDSRMVGTIKKESILGKVILRFYTWDSVYSDETGEYITKGRIVFDTRFDNKK